MSHDLLMTGWTIDSNRSYRKTHKGLDRGSDNFIEQGDSYSLIRLMVDLYDKDTPMSWISL